VPIEDGPGGKDDVTTRLRTGVAARLLAATLAGVADALDDRVHDPEPQVEDRPDEPDDRWLLLLDREDPSRSLIIVPHRVVAACRARDARARAAALATAGDHPAASADGVRAWGHRRRWSSWPATVLRRWTTSAPS
jgi:hypothetical protein